MTQTIVTPETTLETISCGQCGTWFAMPARMLEERRETGDNFYCPNGHPRVFRTTEADKLRETNKRLSNQLTHTRDQLEATERSRDAYKGHLTRLRKRIDQGVCPHCQRSFKNVMLHMSHKHPEKVDEARQAMVEVPS